jgi:putative Ca2+/H+ antiporter (TMEM165/GDT1 family)
MLLTASRAFAADVGLQATISNSGFVESSLLIFVSEIGDKTFFIAGLLAAKYGKSVSFVGSIAALALMTVMSTIIGQMFHAVPASLKQGVPYDDYVAVLAFAYFGVKILLEASNMDGSKSGLADEQREAAAAVQSAMEECASSHSSGKGMAIHRTTRTRQDLFAQLAQIFSLVFAAEIGDRSFLSTIALSASQNPYAVASGAIVAHALATGIAVLGGDLMSKYLSEKVIGYIGGCLFLIFAVTTAIGLL